MVHRRLRITILICCAFLSGVILTGVILYSKPTGRLSNFEPRLGSGTVHMGGFVPPGSETQQELELLAKSGIEIHEAAYIVKPVIIDVNPGEDPRIIDPTN